MLGPPMGEGAGGILTTAYIVLLYHMLCNEPCQSVCVPLHTGMMLKENNTLKKLYLGGCRLQPEELEEVIKGVQVNTNLETLDLSDSTIDAKRASCLGKNAFHTHIHQLVMSD